ncbi:MAG: MoaD/ThiS family protein [Thermoplasmataceae archaeon]|jgi:MoaD family protein|nr:MoaD/ThiS family protein [Candidatus Thermoplasmatota archaeon]
MKIVVRYFALFRDITGTDQDTIVVDEGAPISDLLVRIRDKYPDMGRTKRDVLVSVNRNFASHELQLKDGDEVAIFPPVSGG